MITQIELHKFRGFDSLKLEGLKRVNLIVGKNNAGKTSLLEGLALACNPKEVWEQLPELFRPMGGDVKVRVHAWLIKDGEQEHGFIRVINDGKSCRVRLLPHVNDVKASHPDDQCVVNFKHFSVDRTRGAEDISCKAMPVRPLDPKEVVKVYAQAAKQKGGEALIEKVLHQVDNRASRIRIDAAEDGNVLLVDLGLQEMLPLTQAGQGMYRLVSLLAGVFGGRPKVALLDEVDDGLHHSVLPEVWKGIAEAAELFDVQVFATTHSAECIEAAHGAYLERKDYDFSVVQLYRTAAGVTGRVLGKDDISAGIDHNIDLR